MSTIQLFAEITWTPGVRGVLVVAVGVIVLMGSVYLLLGTNTGPRLGFQVALAGLLGWMAIMGLIWSMYGIGYLGRGATWHVVEVNYDDLSQAQLEQARGLPRSDELPDPEDILAANPDLAEQFPVQEGVRRPGLADLLAVQPELQDELAQYVPDGWTVLSASDPQTGEAQASASAYLVDERQLFAAASDFVVVDGFSYGGKEKRDGDSLVDRALFKVERVVTWPLGHPTHYAAIQVQRVVPQETEPGQPPPRPKADPEQPVVTVIMERDLGTKRLPGIGVFFGCGALFLLVCESLHRRDKLVAQARAAAKA